MRKKVLLISLIIIITICLIAFFSFNTIGLKYMSEDEHIVFCSKYWNYTISVVSDTGNVYLNSCRLTDDKNYGLENVRKFNNHDSKKYVSIYDKEDAEAVNLTHIGGTIVTKNNDVYVFQNGSDIYRTPTYICSGYRQAMLWDNSRLYLLSSSGDFGYIDIYDNQNIFNCIGRNVKEFNIVEKEKDHIIFLLTENDRLYFLKQEDILENNEKYINDIADFDVLVPHDDRIIISILNTNSEAYFLMGDYDLSFDELNNSKIKYHKSGDNMTSVTSYGRGIAMLDDQHQVYLYGDDFDGVEDCWSFSSDLDFKGDLVFQNVESVYGGFMNLDIIKQNGEFRYYGLTQDQTYKYIKESK